MVSSTYEESISTVVFDGRVDVGNTRFGKVEGERKVERFEVITMIKFTDDTGTYAKWTNEELQYLKDNYGKVSKQELCSVLNTHSYDCIKTIVWR